MRNPLQQEQDSTLQFSFFHYFSDAAFEYRGESSEHINSDVLLPTLNQANVVPMAINLLCKRFLR